MAQIIDIGLELAAFCSIESVDTFILFGLAYLYSLIINHYAMIRTG